MTKSECRQLAEQELAKLSDGGLPESVIIEENTVAKDWGFVFFYQSKDYLRSGNISDMLAGNAPIIVNRNSGEVIQTGTAKPIESYVDDYEARLHSGT